MEKHMLQKSPEARTRVLMEGILLGESPRWHDGRLWFADWIAQKLYSLDESGKSQVEASIASLPFSIDWLPDGRMLVVNAAENTLQRREADGRFVTHADLSGLSAYGCNEIVADGRGNVYVNNINFRFMEEEFRPGFIALLRPDGTLRKVADGLAFPNGMAITPDNRTLIVAESFNGNLTAYDIAADGSLGNQRVWAKLEGQGGDGLCFDAEGAVWVAAGPRCARIREGGEVLDEIQLDRMAFACMLGGADGKTLYIVQAEWTGEIAAAGSKPTGQVVAARVDVPHAGYPRA
jgi:sugar lactone lactonase YvrE